MYYLGDFANFSEITDEDRARSKKYARRGAIGYGGLNAATLSFHPRYKNLSIGDKTKGALSGLAFGYLGGKLVSRLQRGKNNRNKK